MIRRIDEGHAVVLGVADQGVDRQSPQHQQPCRIGIDPLRGEVGQRRRMLAGRAVIRTRAVVAQVGRARREQPPAQFLRQRTRGDRRQHARRPAHGLDDLVGVERIEGGHGDGGREGLDLTALDVALDAAGQDRERDHLSVPRVRPAASESAVLGQPFHGLDESSPPPRGSELAARGGRPHPVLDLPPRPVPVRPRHHSPTASSDRDSRDRSSPVDISVSQFSPAPTARSASPALFVRISSIRSSSVPTQTSLRTWTSRR
ncbi:hypothetical protein RhoFasK5_00571|nr:hypothetical protein [Rhodococcus kroppenstedtii]